jgi:Secretion system C-terminal sorting domain/Predicted periplasmic protein (DUF2271)
LRKYLVLQVLILLSFVKICSQTAGVLSASFTTSATTSPSFGTYNSVVAWIEDKNGVYIKTLALYGINHRFDLQMWVTANPNFDVVDAVVGATCTGYGLVNTSWNGTDKTKTLVSDDSYTLRIELCDNNSVAWNEGSFKFQKSTTVQSYRPVNQSGYSNVSIQWLPAGTGLTNMVDSKLYNVYPNPAKSTVFVDGVDIQSIDVLTLQGQFVKNSKEQSIDLTNLQKGQYLLYIHTLREDIIKKFIKQ